MKITRRKLAALLAAPAARHLPAAAAEQAQPAATDLEQAAKDRIRANGEALASAGVPMSTEPAFQFKA
jgi:hypothetical protein